MQWNVLVGRSHFLLFLKAQLNGSGRGCLLRGCAEHAVDMMDTTEWCHTDIQATTITLPTEIINWKAKALEFKYVAL